ncbi:MAG TPA: serine/threonine protein kinase [Spirochaetota bacterium]|nr:serine/threonine protein kinase [Spirochaetota bacterium]HOR45055.1 serine/threonine protein kinase [Spirochaetota bacterium]HPK56713.1 serine/threonine protein kinase [Spirochaetota bacterium]
MSDNYYSLKPETILKAAEKLNLNPTGHILQLNSLENRVYSLYLEDSSQVVIKIYRPGRWNENQILEEHSFLNELKDDDIPVCAPLTFEGKTLHFIDDFIYTVFPKNGGRIPDEFSDDDLMMIGRLIARIHNTGRRKNAVHRIKICPETFVRANLDFMAQKQLLPQRYLSVYHRLAEKITTAFDEASTDMPFHRIHGDFHWGNLLKRDSSFIVLDFDDFVTGPAVQDIWMLAPASDAEGQRKREALLEGYREFAEFDRTWLNLAPVLKAMRFINYACWIGKRYDDPAFKNAFPHYGTDNYWESEIKDIEAILLESGIEPESKSELLENKEYFFDM